MREEAETPRLVASVVALFPESLRSFVGASILGRAIAKGALAVEEVQIRDFATDKHRTVDDTPSGGGPGLVLRVDVVVAAIREAIRRDEERGGERRRRVVLLDPAGAPFTQKDAIRLAGHDHLVLVCGRYEGIDARARAFVDEILSIGDYVLTGGELAAAVVLDATARELPGVLGNEASALEESHREGILEHRQYTRPNAFEGLGVPPILLSGDHGAIRKARRKDALVQTKERRPDLFAKLELSEEDRRLLDDERVPLLGPTKEQGA